MQGSAEKATAGGVAIVGGGIGGLTAALALARDGIPSTVFEQAPEFDTVGAGIQLSPNASRHLIALGLGDVLADTLVEPSALAVRDGVTGRLLSRARLRETMTRRYGAPYWVVHRGDLQRAMLDRIADTDGIKVRTGLRVSGVEIEGDGAILRIEGDGNSTERFGAVIGADGIRSAVRDFVAPGHKPRPADRTAWRGVIEANAMPDGLPADEIGLWLSPDRHLVHYPVSGGRAVNIVSVLADREGGAPASPEDIAAGLCHLAHDLVRHVSGLVPWPLMDIAPLPRWSKGPVTLVGDAAHATLPFLAQGGGMAIEDGVAVARQLAANPEKSMAFKAFEAARRQRCGRIQRTSRHNGRIYHLGGPAALARNLVLLAMGDRLIRRYDWIYSHGQAPH